MRTTRKIVFGVFLLGLILAISVVVVAKPNTDNLRDIVPAHAVQISEGVFSLGEATDPVSGKLVQGFMFIDDRKANSHKPNHNPGEKGDKGGGDKTSSTCYSLFAKDAKWKTTENYTTSAEVDLALTEASLNAWDTEVSFDIFGTGTTGATNVTGSDGGMDGSNEVELSDLGPSNTIAYTIVWGIFGGPPQGRELVEWDAVFNTDYAWSDSGEAGKMDYQNIATHEFGHALGLGHSPTDIDCVEETMYPTAGYGETNKRTLETGDLTGLGKLYS